MKKVISISIAIIIGVNAFAQDTIPGQPKSPTAPSTVPDKMNPNLNDTSRSGTNKWPKDSVNKNTWPNTDTTLRNNRTGTDSMGNANTMQPGRDSSMRSGNGNTAQQPKAQDSSYTSKSSKDTASASSEKMTDRIMMKDDQMYLVKNNESSILDKNYKLESGVVITKDGDVKYPGGKTVKLKNGQFIELAPVSDKETSTGTKTSKTKSTKKTKTTSAGTKKKDNG